MTTSVSYRVEHRDGCRLIFGQVPMRDMSALMMSGQDGEVMDTHLASMTGATLVLGTQEALEELRKADDLPVNPLRTSDRDAAEAAGLPKGFCDWLYSGERGISSDFIARCITGIPARAEFGIPHDVGDFKRCLGVITALRGYASESDILSQMGEQSEQWRNLAENWSILKDMAGKSGAQCGSFMQSIFRKGDAHE